MRTGPSALLIGVPQQAPSQFAFCSVAVVSARLRLYVRASARFARKAGSNFSPQQIGPHQAGKYDLPTSEARRRAIRSAKRSGLALGSGVSIEKAALVSR